MKIVPAWIELEGADPELERIINDVFAERLEEDVEFQAKIDEICIKALWQDYEDEHYNSPECNQ
jgi:hypothetical protein